MATTYVWPDIWPIIAAEIGICVGPAQAMSVRETVSNGRPLGELVRRHRLAVLKIREFFSASPVPWADFALGQLCTQRPTAPLKSAKPVSRMLDTAESVVK